MLNRCSAATLIALIASLSAACAGGPAPSSRTADEPATPASDRDTSHVRIMAPEPPPPSQWHCFKNGATPELDNGCGISYADCLRHLKIHARNAKSLGVSFQDVEGCTLAVEAPWCVWFELDADRRGYQCSVTKAACERASDAATFHPLSECMLAPMPRDGYAGQHR